MRLLLKSLVLILSILLLAGCVSAATLTVDDSGGSDYTRIKDAINNASNEDTILVYSGIYYENVNVNRPLILKSIDTGGGNAVVDAGKNGHAIILSAGNSTLEGFTIINASVWPNAGIYVNSNYNIIRSNNASNNGIGIDLSYSSNNMLFGNNASNNGIGIDLSYSSNNMLKNNNASSNNYYGIDLSYSNNNTLSGNYASNNYDYDGIYLYFSSNNTLIGNYASKNNYAGIYLYSSNNTLIGNYALNNYYGIWLSGSNNNFLYQNNLISNTHNAYDTGTNQWDSGVMGNYWSDYTGTDANNDTIGDTPYPIPGGTGVDRYPLIEPWVTIPIPISTPAPSATRLTASTSNEISPAIMKDSSDKIWLFYASDATGNYDIYYKTSNDNGATWSSEQPFVTDSSNMDGVYGISAMQDSSGKIWVAWAKGTSFNFDIYYKTSTDGGNTWSPSIRFTSYSGDDMSPSIFQDKTGKIWIVWRSFGIESNDDIWAKTSSDSGATWSNPIAISTDPAREDAPFATVDSSGKIWVIWRKEIASGNWNVYMRTSGDNGNTWSSASEMTNQPGFEDHPSIIKASSGKVWLFWDSASDMSISYMYSLDNGATWSSISLFTSSSSNRCPRMLQDSSGKVWLVWSSNAEGNYDIWSSIISQVPSTPILTIIEVSPPSPMVKVGNSLTFTATPKDQNGNPLNVPLTWSSSNTSIGTIDQNGVFTAKALGSTIITATSGSVSGSDSVDVVSHKVAYIPVIYKDTPVSPPLTSVNELKYRADQVKNYYWRQSYGKVNIGYKFILDNGNWITLDNSFSHYGSPSYDTVNPDIQKEWNAIREDAINKSNIVPADYDAIVIIQPNQVKAYTDTSFNLGIPVCKIGKKIVVGINNLGYDDPYSTWSHELGHALFKFADYYGSFNLCSGGDVKYWGLMGFGNLINPPTPIMSYNKIQSGWLKPNLILPVTGYGKHEIRLLSKMSDGDNVTEYSGFPNLASIYIFEGRAPPDDINKDIYDDRSYVKQLCYDFWGAQKCVNKLSPDEGILLYQTNMFGSLSTIPNMNIKDFAESQSNVTIRIGEGYLDDFAQVSFMAKKEDSKLYIDIQPNILFSRKVAAILGIITNVNLGSSAEALQTNISGDIDLHLYTYDGKHVGMNYTSLVYERQVGDSRASGNILGGGPEWISIPDNISAYYILDATPAREWAKELNVTLGNITATLQIVQYNENGTRRESLPFTINVSLNNPTVVGGIIYGTAFNDFNRNRKQDTGEAGLANWTIQLKGFDTLKLTSITRTAVTDMNGSYSFTNLNPGNYFVYVTPLPMWIPTTSPASSISLKKGDSAILDFGNRRII